MPFTTEDITFTIFSKGFTVECNNCSLQGNKKLFNFTVTCKAHTDVVRVSVAILPKSSQIYVDDKVYNFTTRWYDELPPNMEMQYKIWDDSRWLREPSLNDFYYTEAAYYEQRQRIVVDLEKELSYLPRHISQIYVRAIMCRIQMLFFKMGTSPISFKKADELIKPQSAVGQWKRINMAYEIIQYTAFKQFLVEFDKLYPVAKRTGFFYYKIRYACKNPLIDTYYGESIDPDFSRVMTYVATYVAFRENGVELLKKPLRDFGDDSDTE